MNIIAQNAFRLHPNVAKQFEHIIAKEMLKAAPPKPESMVPTQKPLGGNKERQQEARNKVLQFVTDEWKTTRQITEESGISVGKVRHRLSAMLVDKEVEMQRNINNECIWIRAIK